MGGGSLEISSLNSTHGSDDGHGSVHHSLFNAVADIKPLSGSLSMLIIISAVVFIEKLFHYANHITDDTPFGDIISRIEKEMMVVGTMAFIFKVIVNTSDFFAANPEWYLALEYAGDYSFIALIFNFLCVLYTNSFYFTCCPQMWLFQSCHSRFVCKGLF